MEKGLDAFEAEQAAPPAEAAPPAVEATKTEDVKTEAVPEPTSEPSQPSEAPKYGKDYQDLLNKFDGDHDKAAKAYWETNNRAAQLAKELEELKSKAAPPATETQPAKEPEPVVPELKRFDESLRAIEAKHAEVRETHANLLAKRTEVRNRIEELTELIAAGEGDFEQDSALRKELRQKQAAAKQLAASIKETEREDADIRREYHNQTILRSQEERLFKLQQAREAEITERNRKAEDDAKKASDAALETFSVTFFQQIPVIAQEGTPIPAELMDDWKAFAKKESHLRLNVEDLPTADIPAFMRKLKADFEASVDRAHRVKSAIYAAKKLKDAEVSAPEGDKAVATTVKRSGFRSQAEVERFMDEAAAAL